MREAWWVIPAFAATFSLFLAYIGYELRSLLSSTIKDEIWRLFWYNAGFHLVFGLTIMEAVKINTVYLSLILMIRYFQDRKSGDMDSTPGEVK